MGNKIDELTAKQVALEKKLQELEEASEKKLQGLEEALEKKIQESEKVLEKKIQELGEASDNKIQELGKASEKKIQESEEALEKKIQESEEASEKKIQESEEELEKKIQELGEASEKKIQESKEALEKKIQELREASEKKIQELEEASEKKIQELGEASEKKIQELEEALEKKIQESDEASEKKIQELREASEKKIQESEEALEKKIQELKLEVNELKESLKLVTGQATGDRETLATVLGDVNKTEMFLKEFYKNFTITTTITDLHNSSIYSLLNNTHVFNETMRSISDTQLLLGNKTDTLTQLVEQLQGCQSGYEVGESNTYPAQAFPLERTVKFDPPFKKTPAFSYGATMFDSTSHLSVNCQLISLSQESFTIKIHTWGKHYALYGARFSWIACPKY